MNHSNEMSAAALSVTASDAIARMAEAAREAPYKQLAIPHLTTRELLFRHGIALFRLAIPVARTVFVTRSHLGKVRDADDVWTAAEVLRPLVRRTIELLRIDNWTARARDFPESQPPRVAQPERAEIATHLLIKFKFFIDLFESSPYATKKSKRESLVRSDIPPFLRRLDSYIELVPTLLLIQRLDALVPVIPEDAWNITYTAVDDALQELIAFALAIEGRYDPPDGLTLPEPMPVLKMLDDWERVLKLRRAHDGAI